MKAKFNSMACGYSVAIGSALVLVSFSRATEYEPVIAKQHSASHVTLPAGNQPVLLSNGIEATRGRPDSETLRTLQPRTKMVQHQQRLSIIAVPEAVEQTEQSQIEQTNAPNSYQAAEELGGAVPLVAQQTAYQEPLHPESRSAVPALAGEQHDPINSPTMQRLLKLIAENAELKAALKIQEIEHKYRNELADAHRELREKKADDNGRERDAAVNDHMQQALDTLRQQNEKLKKEVEECQAVAKQIERAESLAMEQRERNLQLEKEIKRLREINDKLRVQVVEMKNVKKADADKESEGDRKDGDNDKRVERDKRDKKNRDRGNDNPPGKASPNDEDEADEDD